MMWISRHCALLKILLAALCICGCSSSDSELNSREDATLSESGPTEPPLEPRVRPSLQQSPADEREGGGREDTDKSKQEKLVVAYIPDYPSKITQPWMLANTSHLIMFYASWCPHSAAAMSPFKATLQYIVDQNITGVHLGKMEVTKNKNIAKNFKIRSTPTFIMYHRRARYVYDDEVSAENLIHFVQQVFAINLTEVSTGHQLSEAQHDHPAVFLLVHDGQMDPDWHQTYSQVAQEKGLMAKFFYTTKVDLVQEFNFTKFPTLIVLKDGAMYRFSDVLSSNNMGKWVSRERYPAFPVVDEHTFRPFTKFVGRKLAILLVHKDPSQQRITEKRLIDTVKRVAESRRVFPHFQFLQLTSVDLAERMTQSWIDSLPYFYIYDPMSSYYYPFQSQPDEEGKGVTENSIIDFCDAVKTKKIEPLGGRDSYTSSLYHLWMRLHTIYMAMVTHRPWVTLGAGFSLCSVVIFYTVMYLRRPASSAGSGIGKRGKKARSAAREKAKRQQLRLRQRQSDTQSTGCQNGSVVRRRRRGEREKEEEEGGEGEVEGEEEGEGREGEGQEGREVEGEGSEVSVEGDSEEESQDSSEDKQHRHKS